MDPEKRSTALADIDDPVTHATDDTGLGATIDDKSQNVEGSSLPNDSGRREQTLRHEGSNDSLTNPEAKTAPSEPNGLTRAETFIVVLAICLSVFLAALDVTIVTTALPTIAESFHSSTGYTWIGSAFLLGQAASTASWGKFSDIFGRKPALLGAVGIFFIGSLICGVSRNIGMLIVGRAIQGLAGGGLLVLDNIVIADLFSLRERGKYYGLIGSTWAIAGALGPVLGGVFADKATWRWCFYINLPISGMVFAMIVFALKLHTPKTPIGKGLAAVDWLGTITLVGGVLMFLLGLEFGGVTHPWDSALVLCLIIFGVVSACAFILIEWRVARYPIMPLQLFRSVSNIASLLACFFHGLVFISASFYLPFYFQAVLGATPILSGVWFLAFMFAISLTAVGTGIYIGKTGRYWECIIFAFFFMTLGFGLFINLPIERAWAKIIIFQILGGIGSGPLFQSPLVALQTNVAQGDTATATATFNLVRNLATSIGVVIGNVLLSNGLQDRKDSLTRSLGPRLANLLTGGNINANVFIVDGLPQAQKMIARQAILASLRNTWIMFTCFAAAGLVVSFLVQRKVLSKDHEEVSLGLEAEEEKRMATMERRNLRKRRNEKEDENVGV